MGSSNAAAGAPSQFNYTNDPSALTSDSLPTVDFSALISGDQHRRSKALHDLAAACRDWGFFILVNHGISETLMNATTRAIKEFMNFPECEKKKYESKSGSDPIMFGTRTITDASKKPFTMWREYLKLHLHPNFDWLQAPQLLREVGQEYTQSTREIVMKLIEAICDVLELDRRYSEEVLKLDSSFRIFTANYYPPCPHPDQAIGIPAHSDPGLFTLLIHNGVAGLQIMHSGEWYNAESPHNSILVNVDDQLEIFSNGRYKSVKHRAVVNEKRERISIVMLNGPSREAVVGPAAPLVEKDGRAMYSSMKYGDYLESKQKENRVKPLVELQRIIQDN